MDATSPPIRAFLSYSHADDDEFGIVEPLVNKLKAFVRAKIGRSLEIFVDRESIGWGTDWRDSISSSVENATIFIPLLSANYLDSEACREEFLAFHSKAEVLGVTELLLPILIFKSALFGPDSPDEVAQIAETRQYKCVEEPMLAGFQSPEWLQCTKDLSESLLDALAKAEASLLAGVPDRDGDLTPADSDNETSTPGTAEDEAGLAELMTALESSIADMTSASTALSPAMEALGEVPAEVGDLPNEPTAKQVTTWTLRLAHGFVAPSNALESEGRRLFEATKSLDETFLQLKQLADNVDDTDMTNSLEEGRTTLIQAFGDLREVADTMEGLLVAMKPAEVLSVPLRKSLQPARRGLTAVRDSLKLIEAWQRELGE